MQTGDFLIPLLLAWVPGLLFVLFRRSIPLVWKLSAVLVFVFYLVWYAPEWSGPALQAWLDQPYQQLPGLFTSILFLIPALLIFAWPLVLWSARQAQHSETAVRQLRTLTIVTLFYWIFWLGAGALGQDLSAAGWQRSFHEWLAALAEVPVPELPKPPVSNQ